MPPHSRELWQEGAAIKSEKLVSEGHFNEKRITELLFDEPASYPGCSGTRCLADNINDLKAQVAANQKGINLISTLIGDYGEEVVQFYMTAIQKNAEQSVRSLLRTVSERFQGIDLVAKDHMDDGSAICLRVEIDAEKGEAVFDFEGTGKEMYGMFAVRLSNFTMFGFFNLLFREFERPRGDYFLCDHLLSSMPNLRRYSSQPRMSQAYPRQNSQSILSQP